MDTMDILKQKAGDFIYQVAARDFAAACRRFDQELVQAFPEAKLKETWLQLVGQAGPFQKILASQAVESGRNSIIMLSCQFEKSPMDIRVVFDQSGQIAGLNQGA